MGSPIGHHSRKKKSWRKKKEGSEKREKEFQHECVNEMDSMVSKFCVSLAWCVVSVCDHTDRGTEATWNLSGKIFLTTQSRVWHNWTFDLECVVCEREQNRSCTKKKSKDFSFTSQDDTVKVSHFHSLKSRFSFFSSTFFLCDYSITFFECVYTLGRIDTAKRGAITRPSRVCVSVRVCRSVARESRQRDAKKDCKFVQERVFVEIFRNFFASKWLLSRNHLKTSSCSRSERSSRTYRVISAAQNVV